MRFIRVYFSTSVLLTLFDDCFHGVLFDSSDNSEISGGNTGRTGRWGCGCLHETTQNELPSSWSIQKTSHEYLWYHFYYYYQPSIDNIQTWKMFADLIIQ